MKQLRKIVSPFKVTSALVAPVASSSMPSLEACSAMGSVTEEKKLPTMASGESAMTLL